MRVGIVIPWFGEDLCGGAEMLAWELANRLQEDGASVTVITTCSQAHQGCW